MGHGARVVSSAAATGAVAAAPIITENALSTLPLEPAPSSASFCAAFSRHAAEPCCLATLARSLLAASTCVGHAASPVRSLHFWSSGWPQQRSLQMTPRCWATEPDMRAAPPGCDGREAARQQAGGPTLPLPASGAGGPARPAIF